MTFGVLAAVAAAAPASDSVTPGVLGFVVFAVMAVALVFLLKSMNKQFRKIGPKPEDLEGTEADGVSEAASQRPLRGLAAHRAAMAAAEAEAERKDAERD